jgi:plastocyanin domain-containing protein
MGMIRSNIKVVSDLSAVTDEEVQDASDNSGAFQAKANIPTDKIGLGEIRDGVQYARIDVGDDRFSPAIIVLEKGVETKLTFSAKELQTHNSSLTFPEYNAGLNLNTGETTIGLTPESDFTFLCSSGTLYGYVKVVDDIDKIDIDKIKDEVKNYQPPNWNIGGAGGASCH